MRVIAAVSLVAVSCASLASAPALELMPQPSTVRDVWPIHINERGDIAFNRRLAQGQAAPFVRWADGHLESISVQQPPPYQSTFAPRAIGVTDAGAVMVEYNALHSTLPARRHVLAYYRGGLSQLVMDVGPTSISSAAAGGNGHLALLADYNGLDEGHLYLRDPEGQTTFVGRPEGGTPIISAVNDYGAAAGHLNRPMNQNVLRVLPDGAVELLDHEHDIYGRGINNHGTVTGSYYDPDGANGEGASTIFVWREGTTEATYLETPDRYESANAFAINDSDWITGRLYERLPDATGGGLLQHAFVYTPELGFINLNDMFADELDGAQLLNAAALNESGTIVGTARMANGGITVFVVTIPSPASSLALGGVALLGLRRRR
jgi:hypothetical protein